MSTRLLAYESIVVEIDPMKKVSNVDKECHVHVSSPFWIHARKTEVRVMPAAGGLRAESLRGHRRHIRTRFSLTLDSEPNLRMISRV
jgi:hypothetical protein